MERGTPIDLRVNENTLCIEYKIGEDGEWVQYGKPYYTYAGAVASMMNLREQTKYGLNESLKALFGIKEK